MKALPAFFIFLTSFLFINCISSVQQGNSKNTTSPDSLDRILVNQVGYLPNSVKIALLRVKTGKFDIVDVTSGKVVFTGKPGSSEFWGFSGDSVCTADFSEVITPILHFLPMPALLLQPQHQKILPFWILLTLPKNSNPENMDFGMSSRQRREFRKI